MAQILSHGSFLDVLLYAYLGIVFLLHWSGKPSLFGGIFLLMFSWFIEKARPGWDMSELRSYAWWFMGGGLVLIIREQCEQWNVVRSMIKFVSKSWQRKSNNIRLTGSLISHKLNKGKGNLFSIPAASFAKKFQRIGFTKKEVEEMYEYIRTIKKLVLQTCSILTALVLVVWRCFQRFSLIIRLKVAIIVAVTMLLFFATQITPLYILLILFLIAGILFSIGSRWAFGVALAQITAIPFLLNAKKESLAEQAAVYAYYFLVIGMVHSIAELRRERIIEKSTL